MNHDQLQSYEVSKCAPLVKVRNLSMNSPFYTAIKV